MVTAIQGRLDFLTRERLLPYNSLHAESHCTWCVHEAKLIITVAVHATNGYLHNSHHLDLVEEFGSIKESSADRTYAVGQLKTGDGGSNLCEVDAMPVASGAVPLTSVKASTSAWLICEM